VMYRLDSRKKLMKHCKKMAGNSHMRQLITWSTLTWLWMVRKTVLCHYVDRLYLITVKLFSCLGYLHSHCPLRCATVTVYIWTFMSEDACFLFVTSSLTHVYSTTLLSDYRL
jgi:hypothetical protein